jgi:hypothetical protein
MFKSIEQKLKDASILDENEPILSFIQVSDYLKQQQQFKKIMKEEIASLLLNSKQYYFLASSEYRLGWLTRLFLLEFDESKPKSA